VVQLGRLRKVGNLDSVHMKYIIDFEFEKIEEVNPKVIGKLWTRFQYMSLDIFTLHSCDVIPSCQKFLVSIVTENSSPIYTEPDLKILCSAHQMFHCLFISLTLATRYAMFFPPFLAST